MRPTDGTEQDRSVDTARTEAFSDGVFAIAATLLVLNLEVPSVPRDLADRELSRAIAALAPSAVSYVLTFLVILAFWTAHRAIFRHVVYVDRPLSWLNGLCLMVVAFLPFSTGLFDRYSDETLAVVVYAGSLALTRLMLTAVWWYASARRGLLSDKVPLEHARFHRLRGLVVSLVFALSIGVAYFFDAIAASMVWGTLFVADQALLHAKEGGSG